MATTSIRVSSISNSASLFDNSSSVAADSVTYVRNGMNPISFLTSNTLSTLSSVDFLFLYKNQPQTELK